jgi:WhiB family redox-sensing transcriptional regulator
VNRSTIFALAARSAGARSPAPRCADGAGTFLGLFFSDDPIDVGRAKAICTSCSLAAACLEGALARREPAGVWGGELIENGAIIVEKRRCGRPPRTPRPKPVIDEMGVVA